MHGYLLAPLLNTLSPHFDLSKTRLETMAIILFSLANGRTVNPGHLASQFPGTALHASSYRRLQRFFEYVRLDGDVVAQLIVGLLNLKGPTLLALDRTNWKLGKTDINILVLAIVTRRLQGSSDVVVSEPSWQQFDATTHWLDPTVSSCIRSLFDQSPVG